ncbi:hypothetical protein ACPRNU_25865, partial [Chromobacterium vaccinii]|uniref:hypothetical protein n=1 Tax=Chromobacterium vaccinii TaxID=1108595 RepID=UPI003C769FDC
FCQSGRWTRQIQNQITIRTHDGWGPDGDIQYCASDEVVTGGGGFCEEPSRHYIHDSYPIEQGWLINCYGVPGATDMRSRAYAICLKK